MYDITSENEVFFDMFVNLSRILIHWANIYYLYYLPLSEEEHVLSSSPPPPPTKKTHMGNASATLYQQGDYTGTGTL